MYTVYAKKITLKYSSKHKQPEFLETSITLDQLVMSIISAFSLLKNKTGKGAGEFFQGPKVFTWTIKLCWKKKKIGSWSIPFIKGLNCYITVQKHSISYRNRSLKRTANLWNYREVRSHSGKQKWRWKMITMPHIRGHRGKKFLTVQNFILHYKTMHWGCACQFSSCSVLHINICCSPS